MVVTNVKDGPLVLGVFRISQMNTLGFNHIHFMERTLFLGLTAPQCYDEVGIDSMRLPSLHKVVPAWSVAVPEKESFLPIQIGCNFGLN